MSFILEALKKAEAERDRGAVPDLHAQAMLPAAAFEGGSDGRARRWRWLLAGAVVALLASSAWQWMRSDAPAVETAAAPAPTMAAPLPVPGLATASMPSSAASPPVRTGADTAGAGTGAAVVKAPATAPATSTAAARARQPNASPDSRSRSGPGAADARPRRPGARPEAESGKTATAKADARSELAPPTRHAGKDATKDAGKDAAKGRPAAPPQEHVPLLAELPDDVRRQVPALRLGGLVYSAAPTSRIVIVNGDVQREGSTIAPGLTLERINPKSAVFSLRGQRFEVPM